MIGWIQSRLRKEDGFTLVELMVVVLIIAILVAIAIPTFLGARTSAQDRAAQSDLRNALTAAKVFYVDNEDYGAGAALTDITYATALEAIEPSLTIAALAAVADDDDGVGAVTGDQVTLFVRQSASTTWFCISDDVGAGGGTTYGSGAAKADVDTAAECADAGW
jgi:type IV pilus assembly protein PilA